MSFDLQKILESKRAPLLPLRTTQEWGRGIKGEVLLIPQSAFRTPHWLGLSRRSVLAKARPCSSLGSFTSLVSLQKQRNETKKVSLPFFSLLLALFTLSRAEAATRRRALKLKNFSAGIFKHF